MKYSVLIEESDEGFAVSVPGLPGCHSQGDTEAEALANIADAIREYLEVVHNHDRRGAGGEHSTAQPGERHHDGQHRARRRPDQRPVPQAPLSQPGSARIPLTEKSRLT